MNKENKKLWNEETLNQQEDDDEIDIDLELQECHGFLLNGDCIGIEIYLKEGDGDFIYSYEEGVKWMKIISKIDPFIKYEINDVEKSINIEILVENYPSHYHAYISMLMVRILYRNKGMLQKIYEIREKTNLYWIKCIQAAHSFFELDDNNFYVSKKGYLPKLYTYKELLATKINWLNDLYIEKYIWDGTIEGILNVKKYELDVSMTKEEFNNIKKIISTKENKDVYICIDVSNKGLDKNSLWMSASDGRRKCYRENIHIIPKYPSNHIVRDNKAVGYIIDPNNLLKIDIKDIKIIKNN